MSFITFNYKCEACGYTEERMVRRSEADSQKCGDDLCDAPMTKLPAATRTTFKFADRKLK